MNVRKAEKKDISAVTVQLVLLEKKL